MPSATQRHLTGLNEPVSQLAYPPSYRASEPLISTWSLLGIGEELAGIGSVNEGNATAYPSANRVHAFPFEIGEPGLVQKVWVMNGQTASTDNFDVGVYDEAGTTLIVHGGSTLIATANVLQEIDCTDTLLLPGRYWCAYAQSGVTATPFSTAAAAANLRACGVAQMAGAVPLGSTFTPAALASAYFPIFGIAFRTQVA